MVVVAGPAGSGKTTLFPVTAFGIDAFSIDDRCAQLQGSYTAISKATRSAVAQECEAFVLRHIAEKRSFAVETTLRTHIAVKQASFARKHGFLTVLRYVATSDIEENVARVTMRALGGGHGAAASEIRDIYRASLGNLLVALQAFELAQVFDTTERWAKPRLVCAKRDGVLTCFEPVPSWCPHALT